jgi:hypothetical protein
MRRDGHATIEPKRPRSSGWPWRWPRGALSRPQSKRGCTLSRSQPKRGGALRRPQKRGGALRRPQNDGRPVDDRRPVDDGRVGRTWGRGGIARFIAGGFRVRATNVTQAGRRGQLRQLRALAASGAPHRTLPQQRDVGQPERTHRTRGVRGGRTGRWAATALRPGLGARAQLGGPSSPPASARPTEARQAGRQAWASGRQAGWPAVQRRPRQRRSRRAHVRARRRPPSVTRQPQHMGGAWGRSLRPKRPPQHRTRLQRHHGCSGGRTNQAPHVGGVDVMPAPMWGRPARRCQTPPVPDAQPRQSPPPKQARCAPASAQQPAAASGALPGWAASSTRGPSPKTAPPLLEAPRTHLLARHWRAPGLRGASRPRHGHDGPSPHPPDPPRAPQACPLGAGPPPACALAGPQHQPADP